MKPTLRVELVVTRIVSSFSDPFPATSYSFTLSDSVTASLATITSSPTDSSPSIIAYRSSTGCELRWIVVRTS